MSFFFYSYDLSVFWFVGKMFKGVDLPYVIQFAVMFHNDKPVDWLLDPLLETRFCPHDSVRKLEAIALAQIIK